ncbi:DNA repair ATPase [Maudiozyma humilis]|uniref:Structural maintenance of chromosomes protein 5 n=1 Tax=Maudiozyma humilis TaxID=51915 RepID=A0AAV5RY90_MAUHU|nr:DNA repair ATPase [Kazachstania humilis]
MQLDLAQYAQLPQKRMKLAEADPAQFQRGNIIKLRLTDFVTYSLAEFTMSPSLNMIIGPNGSGKSTVVCALCLGLAGKPEFIGRAKSVDSFINVDSPSATIEVTLRDTDSPNGSTSTIKRKMLRGTGGNGKNKGTSQYWLNGEPCSEGQIRKYVRGMNVQLDNLCQFLSQERVEEFAQLRSNRLLHETARAVDVRLAEALESLKEMQLRETTAARDVQLKRQRLAELQQRRDTLNENVRSLRQYEAKAAEMQRHQLLLPYACLKDHKEKLRSYRDAYKDAKKQLRELGKHKSGYVAGQQIITTNREGAERESQKTHAALAKVRAQFDQQKRVLGEVRDSIAQKRKQIEYYRHRTDKINKSIEETQQVVLAKRESISAIQLPDPQRFQEISDEKSRIIQHQQALKGEINEIRAQANSSNNQITRVQNRIRQKRASLESNDKLDLLDQGNRHDLREIKNAVQFIRTRANEDPQIAQQVLDPPLISVAARDPAFAKYIAVAVPFASAVALTVTSNQAFERYSDEITKRFRINLRELKGQELPQPMPREELVSRYGFEGYLSDFITGDQRVIQMLREFHNIHTIPVSRREMSAEQLNALMRPGANGKPLFSQILHGNSVLALSTSQTNQLYARSRNIEQNKNAHFYASSAMSDEMQRSINREIEDMEKLCKTHQKTLEELSIKLNALNGELKESEHTFYKFNRDQDELNEVRNRHSKLQSDIELLEEKLARFRREAQKDVSSKIQEVEQQIASEIKGEGAAFREMSQLLAKLSEANRVYVKQQIAAFKFANMQTSLHDLIKTFNQREEELSEEYLSKKQNFEERKNSAEYLVWAAEVKAYSAEQKADLEELAEQYNSADTFTVEHVRETLERLQSELSMTNHDASAISILEKVERELAQINETLPGEAQQLEALATEIQGVRTTLEPRLDDITAKISSKFAQLFTRVGSAGAVQLNKPDMFSEWEIEIRVKFRDSAPLKRLDGHTQSGGERAVSTVLYMIALQDLTAAPFRVLDEINQGMDRRNERIVHRAMVENACKDNTSQYFLITPKLLTDLYYHDKMRIHCVMAGPWIPNPLKARGMERFGETANYVF